MSWFCSVCEKSFSRKDSMQRHVMSEHRNVGLTRFQTVPFSQKNDHVRKNGPGSISITTSFRDNLPYSGEDCLVLFTMAACIYRKASRHATD